MVERWSNQQDAALVAASRWLASPDQQVFRLFGYAGTGKTTLATHLAEGVDGSVCFAAFTGKAALVMRARGCPDARTIHSLIYRPRDIDTEEPSFVLNHESDATEAALIVIDECSMVDEALGRDLLSFGKPVLVLGDPAQLPPVKGGGFFTEADPDIMLTDIHRQAAGDPIIRMSMDVREGKQLTYGQYDESQIISREDIDTATVTGADQVLVGMNKTRRNYNRRLREILGFHTAYPESGDKLVCLKNDPQKGLLNGGLWRAKTGANERRGRLRLTVVPDEEPNGRARRVSIAPQFFDSDDEVPFSLRRNSDEFDYGYALTVHKSQGSQWDDIVLFDESYAFREHRNRWLYTGITRAARRLTIVM